MKTKLYHAVAAEMNGSLTVEEYGVYSTKAEAVKVLQGVLKVHHEEFPKDEILMDILCCTDNHDYVWQGSVHEIVIDTRAIHSEAVCPN